MTAVMERVLPFGSGEATEQVLTGMVEHENQVDSKIVYYVTRLTRRRKVVAGRAIAENADLPAVVRDVLPVEFRAGEPVWLTAGLSEDLFVSLVAYAMRKSVCDVVADVHGGYVGKTCDCKLRREAREWAREIAMQSAGVELA
jgi:hypothetical protein